MTTEPDFLAVARARAAARRRGPDCSIGALLRSLDVENPVLASSIRAALASELQHTILAETFAEDFGYDISDSTIGRHRRRKCECAA